MKTFWNWCTHLNPSLFLHFILIFPLHQWPKQITINSSNWKTGQPQRISLDHALNSVKTNSSSSLGWSIFSSNFSNHEHGRFGALGACAVLHTGQYHPVAPNTLPKDATPCSAPAGLLWCLDFNHGLPSWPYHNNKARVLKSRKQC